jgi:hypothetical protein
MASSDADLLGLFETSSDGTALTNTILDSCFEGTKSGDWFTVDDPTAQTAGSTPDFKIASAASRPRGQTITVNGSAASTSADSKGIRVTLASNQCIQIDDSGGNNVAIGFHFRWCGPYVNNGPRDIVGMRSDPTGNYQFMQATDDASSPNLHAHWSPGGSGIGSAITIEKDRWYWCRMVHVDAPGTFTLEVYEAQNKYALLGTSSGSVSGTDTTGTTTLQLGIVNYFSGSSQQFDFDNVQINWNGTPIPVPDIPVGKTNPPNYIASATSVAFNSSTTPRSTGNLTGLVNDVLVSLMASEEDVISTTGTNVQLIGRRNVNVAGGCGLDIRSGTVTTAATVSASMARGTPVKTFGGHLLQYRDTDGVGASAVKTTVDATATINLTTTRDNSDVLVVIGDWSAGGFTTPVYRPSGYEGTITELEKYHNAAAYTCYVVRYANVGAAGAKTFGLSSGYSGTAFTLAAIEVLGQVVPTDVDRQPQPSYWHMVAASGGIDNAEMRDVRAWH